MADIDITLPFPVYVVYHEHGYCRYEVKAIFTDENIAQKFADDRNKHSIEWFVELIWVNTGEEEI